MKKQIVYSKFIPRVFAMTIDLVILSIILTPVMNLISTQIFIHTFQEFFILNNVDMTNTDDMAVAVRLPEFTEFVTASKFLTYTGIIFLINTFFMGIYFVTFWYKLGATPGKMLMRLKIVDADDYSKPSLSRCIKRFIGYITAIIGIWSMIFSKRGISLHDKIANTVVIKS